VARLAASALALVLGAAILSAGCARPAAAPSGPAPAGPVAPGLPDGVDVAVVRVVDGDTIVVTGKRTVRLIGVDTPETVDPNRPVGCFGKEASAFLESLLPRGSPVRLVGDVEQQDRYGRTLAYVYRRADGLFVNAELVRQGFATALTITPNLAHTDELVDLARDARNAGRGLWSACPA